LAEASGLALRASLTVNAMTSVQLWPPASSYGCVEKPPDEDPIVCWWQCHHDGGAVLLASYGAPTNYWTVKADPLPPGGDGLKYISHLTCRTRKQTWQV